MESPFFILPQQNYLTLLLYFTITNLLLYAFSFKYIHNYLISNFVFKKKTRVYGIHNLAPLLSGWYLFFECHSYSFSNCHSKTTSIFQLPDTPSPSHFIDTLSRFSYSIPAFFTKSKGCAPGIGRITVIIWFSPT